MLDRIAEVVHRTPYGDVMAFLAFSHGWSWAFWGVNVVAGLDAFGAGLPFTLLGGVGPMLGGIVASYLTYGRDGVTDLRARLTEVSRVRPSWALIVVGTFPLLLVLTAGVTAAVTGAARPLDASELDALLTNPVALFATVLVIVVIGPLPEEIGWRGYLLDRCQVRWSAVTSGLFVGVVWAAWHAPLFLMPGYFANFDYTPEPTWYVAQIILGSILYTWIHNNTARSLLAVIAFHSIGNFVGQVTELPPAGEPIAEFVRAGVVLAVVAVFGARTLRRDGSVPEPPEKRFRARG